MKNFCGPRFRGFLFCIFWLTSFPIFYVYAHSEDEAQPSTGKRIIKKKIRKRVERRRALQAVESEELTEIPSPEEIEHENFIKKILRRISSSEPALAMPESNLGTAEAYRSLRDFSTYVQENNSQKFAPHPEATLTKRKKKRRVRSDASSH